MKGICFVEPLFHAVIEGRKTQTRRIIKPQPVFFGNVKYTVSQLSNGKIIVHDDYDEDNMLESLTPRYSVGEMVYLKEPYHVDNDGFIYYNYAPHIVMDYEPLKWQNKLFMPERAARYFIEITEVRVERLNEISDDDCIKEGIFEHHSFTWDDEHYYPSPREAYAALIDKINGKGTWESNPYVFVYDFKFLKPETQNQ